MRVSNPIPASLDTPIVDSADAAEFIVPEQAREAREARETETKPADKPAAPVKKNIVEPPVDNEDDAPQEDAPVKKPDADRAKVSYEMRKLQRELKQIREELIAARDAQKAPEAKLLEAPKRPKPSQFKLGIDDDAYIDALDAYDAAQQEYMLKRTADLTQARVTEAEQTRAQRQEEQRFLQKAAEIEKRGIDKYPDFEEAITDAFTAMQPDQAALTALAQMNGAEDVLYYLASNQDKLAALTEMSPMAQAFELGRLATHFAAKPSTKLAVTKAQGTPKAPSGGGASAGKAGDDAVYLRMLQRVNARTI